MFRKFTKRLIDGKSTTVENHTPSETVIDTISSEEPASGLDLEQFMVADHRHCDELWAMVEAAVEAQDGIGVAVQVFTEDFERHLQREEEVIFPAFEDATGMHGVGPTMMMRHEHEQMRAVIAVMLQAHRAGDDQQLLSQGDTLLMLTQQHNMKEEQILYPMANQAIGGQWPELQERM